MKWKSWIRITQDMLTQLALMRPSRNFAGVPGNPCALGLDLSSQVQ